MMGVNNKPVELGQDKRRQRHPNLNKGCPLKPYGAHFQNRGVFVRSAATQKHIISWQTADDSSIRTMNCYTKLYMCSFEYTSSSYIERRSNWSSTFLAILRLHLSAMMKL